MKRLILFAAVLLCATSLYALPDVSHDVWYYDSSGNIIGWWSIACNGHRSSGGTTSEIYEDFTMPCQTLEPITCADNGMYELGSCEGWCYSEGYVMSYNYDVVPDCEGNCLCGEFQPCSQNGPTCSVKNRAQPRPKSLMRARSADLPLTMRRGIVLALARSRPKAAAGVGTHLLAGNTLLSSSIYRFVQPPRACNQKKN